MTEIRCAAVIGLGLIGGSLARGLVAAGTRVLGWDRDPETLRAAGAGGVAALGAELAGVEEAEVVVLAVPVLAAPELLERLLPRLRGARLVTDVGSTKAAIAAEAERLRLGDRFIGSHPLAGDHRAGWPASRAGLFCGARVFVCPAPAARPDALALARALWRTAGAHPEIVDAAEHDRLLAWTSHLPQAAATALARALSGAGVDPAQLGPGGRDTTRLAASHPEVWTGIALQNGAALAAAMESLENELREARGAIARGDAEAIRRFFSAGWEWRATP